jgi:ribonuclease HI
VASNEPSPAANRPLRDLLAEIGDPEWDALVVADGSGSGWSIGAGWATAVCLPNGRRALLKGAACAGTTNLAELMGPLWALLWYDANHGRAVRKRGRLPHVHVLSDSEVTVRTGRGEYEARGALKHLWCAVRSVTRDGLRVSWHWTPRDTTALNALCDHASRQARLAVQALTVPALLGDPSMTVYEFNPASDTREHQEEDRQEGPEDPAA